MNNKFFLSINGLKTLLIASLVVLFTACASAPPPPAVPKGQPKPYRVGKNWYKPMKSAKGFTQKGIASWYGKKFHGRKTSSGEIYNMYGLSAAHKTLPLGAWVRVKNLNNNKTLDVRINDRGPFVHGRIIDLSYAAAQELAVVGPGTAPVIITALGKKPSAGVSDEAYIPMDYYSGKFTFQVGAFSSRDNAERLRKKLGRTFTNAHISPFDRGDMVFYRVRVGSCRSLEDAEAYEKTLSRHGFPDAIIVAE